MSLPARAAAVRGDDYQYAVAWRYAAEALIDPGVESISIGDAGGGSFDDVVVRRNDALPDLYLQVKSSNWGDVAIDEQWLTTPPTDKGKSPLQHFHATWKQLSVSGKAFEAVLIANRGFDHTHPILGQHRDNLHERVDVERLGRASARTKAGKARTAWAAHLQVPDSELLSFLRQVRWRQAGAEDTWRRQAKAHMRLAGLRHDDEAVEVGVGIMRYLVKTGAGPQTPDDLRDNIALKNLTASPAHLLLAVHAIDTVPSERAPDAVVDWTGRFVEDDPRRRYQPADLSDWHGLFREDLRQARVTLEKHSTRRVFVTGALRLGTGFAVGHTLPDVRHWVLGADQRGQVWWSDQTGPDVDVSSSTLDLNIGDHIAVVIALSNDILDDVLEYVAEEQLPIKTVLALTGPTGPGGASVTSNVWLTSWVRQSRDLIRRSSKKAGHIHLFMSAPLLAALMLGHQWNTIYPPTTLHEYGPGGYFPSYTFH